MVPRELQLEERANHSSVVSWESRLITHLRNAQALSAVTSICLRRDRTSRIPSVKETRPVLIDRVREIPYS